MVDQVMSIGLPQAPVPRRQLRRNISERKLPDLEVLPFVYLLVVQVLEKARVPLAVAETALEMALDECRDKRIEASVTWATGTPDVKRSDQFSRSAGRHRR
jgi:hypothetical protein